MSQVGLEDFVKESLLSFLKENITNAVLSHVDDIVLNYVVSIMEELGMEGSSEETFDVEAFSEMLAAYFPEFSTIPHGKICKWLFDLSFYMNSFKSKAGELSGSFCQSNFTLSYIPPVKTKRSPRTSESDEACCKRSPRLSECSDLSTDSTDITNVYESEFTAELELLSEMFPSSCANELSHCLMLANGTVDRAAQLILHRQEIGESLPAYESSAVFKPKSCLDDKSMKKKIIAKYSYVDNDEDQREHRPPPLKQQPKKLVRYLDNKVVTIKGEKFTEIKNDKEDKEEIKKTYVSLKPARQYRFH
nr:EOG090X0A55 [Lepidurus arcticus]